MKHFTRYTKEYITMLVFVLFVCISIIIIYIEIPNANRDIFLIMFGVLSGKIGTILDFWYGSSKEDRHEDTK
jgi:hypothetical protein